MVEGPYPQPERGQLEDRAYVHLHHTHELHGDHRYMDISLVTCFVGCSHWQQGLLQMYLIDALYNEVSVDAGPFIISTSLLLPGNPPHKLKNTLSIKCLCLFVHKQKEEKC